MQSKAYIKPENFTIALHSALGNHVRTCGYVPQLNSAPFPMQSKAYIKTDNFTIALHSAPFCM